MITTKTKRNIVDNGMLGEGIYQVEIVTSKVEKRKSKAFNDITPFLKVCFLLEKENKFIERWYPLLGYKRNDSGDYLLKEGKRIKDSKRTLIAQSIIKKLFADVCVEPGSIDFVKLTGFKNIEHKFVGISVTSNDEGNTFVNYTIPEDCLEAKDNRHKKLGLIENIFEKMLIAGEITGEGKNWHGKLFDELYDMDIDELDNFEKQYGLTIISRSHDNDKLN